MLFSTFSVLNVSANESNIQSVGEISGVTGSCLWYYNSNTKTLTISGNGEMENYNNGSVPSWDGYKKDIKNIIIDHGVTKIGFNSFNYYSHLENVTISNTVKIIGDGAFAHCTKIKNVYYKGSSIQWKSIDIYYGNDCLTNSNFYYEVKSQTISAKSFTKIYGDKAFNLGAKAKTKLKYKSSNNKVATVSANGKVTIKGLGKATITITAVSSAEYKSATKKITVNVKLKPINKNTLKSKMITKSTVKVYWKKVSGVNGYHIKVSTSVKGVSINNERKQRATSVLLKNARKGQKIYLSVRTYKKVGKKVYYSSWNTKTIVFK